MVWWVSERAIKIWLPYVRRSLRTLVARGYLEKRTADGRIFYRLNQSRPRRRSDSRKGTGKRGDEFFGSDSQIQ